MFGTVRHPPPAKFCGARLVGRTAKKKEKRKKKMAGTAPPVLRFFVHRIVGSGRYARQLGPGKKGGGGGRKKRKNITTEESKRYRVERHIGRGC